MFSFSKTGSTALALMLLAILFVGCDRGATAQEDVARNFSDAVTRNDAPKRDSMIATYKFKEYFANQYVASDMMSWFRSFYDYKEKRFFMPVKVDVDRNLEKDLEGALLDTNKIVETGIVRVPSSVEGAQPAIFWMVKQSGKPWRVAIVTRGESQVLFH